MSSLQMRQKKALDAANNELEINLDNALKVRGAIGVFFCFSSFVIDLSFASVD